MNREQKEFQLQSMYKGLSYADKIIWAHTVASYVGETKGIDDALPKMDPEEFEIFYEETTAQWNNDGTYKSGDPSPSVEPSREGE